MASPEAYDIPEESPDELLDENMKEPNSSPVLEGSCTSDPAYPPETCVEPEWVDASEQDSKITSDTLTSETYSEVQPDGSLGHGVRAFGETPEIIQEFDWTLSSESKAGNTTKGAQSAMVNETMELPVESAACEIRPNADLINVARLSMESSSPPPKTQGGKMKGKKGKKDPDESCVMFNDHRVSGTWKSCAQCCSYVRSLAKEIED